MRNASQLDWAVEQYGDLVRRICFLHLKNESDADDVFQEVFLKYLTHPAEFEGPEHEKAWLIRVAVNRCKDCLRSFFRRKVQGFDETAPAALGWVPPPQHSAVYDAVLSLPKDQRAAVFLFYYEGYTAPEIARILGRNENTVYTWLSRARAALRATLGGEEYA